MNVLPMISVACFVFDSQFQVEFTEANTHLSPWQLMQALHIRSSFSNRILYIRWYFTHSNAHIPRCTPWSPFSRSPSAFSRCRPANAAVRSRQGRSQRSPEAEECVSQRAFSHCVRLCANDWLSAEHSVLWVKDNCHIKSVPVQQVIELVECGWSCTGAFRDLRYTWLPVIKVCIMRNNVSTHVPHNESKHAPSGCVSCLTDGFNALSDCARTSKVKRFRQTVFRHKKRSIGRLSRHNPSQAEDKVYFHLPG